MKKIVLILGLISISLTNTNNKTGKATYYDTTNHKKVHRTVPTAAYCHSKYRNMRMVITNLKNKVTDTVTITDRHSMGSNHVDLSHLAFDRLTQLDTITDKNKRDRKRKVIGAIAVSFKLIK